MSKPARMIAWLFLGSLASALVVAVLYVLLAGANTTQAIRETQVNNRTLLNTINGCTNKTGQCFKDGQKRTAGYIGQITQRATASAACQIVLTRQQPPVSASARDLYQQLDHCTTETLALLKQQGGSR
jgi:hypothetical protein